MSDILSQTEIDSLINALSKGQPLGRNKDELQVDTKQYNFRKPNKFTKDQLQTLYMINEKFSRFLANFLSGYLRSSVDIKIASVEQATYEEFLLSIISPSMLTVFKMSPLNGSAMMQSDSNFTFPVIDLMFGGTGKRNIQPKEFTEIELRVLKRLSQKILENMAIAWSDVFSFRPMIESMETNPQLSQIVSPNETVAIVTFTAVVADNHSIVCLCFPWETLREAIPNLTAQKWFASRKYLDSSQSKDIENNLEKVFLNISACCGETELTIKELLHLEVGDVILLNTVVGEDMDLLIEDCPKFKVQPGIIGNKLATVVTGNY